MFVPGFQALANTSCSEAVLCISSDVRMSNVYSLSFIFCLLYRRIFGIGSTARKAP